MKNKSKQIKPLVADKSPEKLARSLRRRIKSRSRRFDENISQSLLNLKLDSRKFY
jgi:hypothetical protein